MNANISQYKPGGKLTSTRGNTLDKTSGATVSNSYQGVSSSFKSSTLLKSTSNATKKQSNLLSSQVNERMELLTAKSGSGTSKSKVMGTTVKTAKGTGETRLRS